MPLQVPDDVLELAGLSADEARLEIACRLFAAGRLELWPAARWCGLSRGEFEAELRKLGIAPIRPSIADVKRDVATFRELGAS